MKKFKGRMEFRPLLSLLVILICCGILSGGSFFSLQIVDGHLYGRLIDILRNGSRYMVLAIGTFVGFLQGYAIHTFKIAPSWSHWPTTPSRTWGWSWTPSPPPSSAAPYSPAVWARSSAP